MSFWNGHRWEAQSPPAADGTTRESRVKRIGAAALEGALITALMFGLIAGTTFAAKGGGGHTTSGGSTGGGLAGPVLVTDTGTAGLSWGDIVTFRVSTSASWPSVELDCSQNGAVVYEQITGFYPTYMWSNNYTLKGFYWAGGAATCTATLYNANKNGSNTTLSTLSFSVGS